MKKPLHLIQFLMAILILLSACSASGNTDNKSDIPAIQKPDSEGSFTLKEDVDNINDYLDYSASDLEKIYFAGGCFWGVEAYIKKIYGVAEVNSGYANGKKANPSYQDVIKGDDGFVETVEVIFDPDRVKLETLVDDLFLVIDPTSENKQGNDVGIQYRTGIYSEDKDDIEAIQQTIDKQQAKYDKEIVTKAEPLENFYLAEDEHQDYLDKNPDGYCHIDLSVVHQFAVQPIEKDKKIVRAHSE